jgi:hypothetical protein
MFWCFHKSLCFIKKFQKSFKFQKVAWNDAILSPRVNPLKGFTLSSCGKLGLRACSRLPTLERGRGSCWEPRDKTRGTSLCCVNLHPKTNQKRLVSIWEHPWVLGTSHKHFDTKDSPRPGLGGSHHQPPYSIIL